MKRLLALLVAAVMITGAFWVRDRIDGDSSSGSGSQQDDSASGATMVCATELGPACKALQAEHPEIAIRVEDAQTTVDQLTSPTFDAGDPAIDAWLVPQPWPQMVTEQRQRAGLGAAALGDPSPTLARSPMVIAIWNGHKRRPPGATAG